MPVKQLTFEQLVGAPLRAFVIGQRAAAQATADFISEVGFETGPGGARVVRQFEFEHLHPVPDPSNPGAVIDTPTRVRVPLLTMLPVPNLRIAEATIAFGANIVDVKPLPKSGHPMIGEPSVQLIGVYAPATSPPNELAPTVTVSIKVTRERPAEGLARLLGLLGDTITAVPTRR